MDENGSASQTVGQVDAQCGQQMIGGQGHISDGTDQYDFAKQTESEITTGLNWSKIRQHCCQKHDYSSGLMCMCERAHEPVHALDNWKSHYHKAIEPKHLRSRLSSSDQATTEQWFNRVPLGVQTVTFSSISPILVSLWVPTWIQTKL